MLATNSDAVFWKPHPGQQVKFLSSPAFEALFGGAAGPGKSDCLVVEALRQVDNPRYNGILFRRTFTRLEGADGLIARSERWYPSYGGKYNAQKHFWKFPSGSRIYFGHIENTGDEQMYQGWQFGYIGFDELTEFERSQYLYLFTRCRADVNSRVRCYVRSATNPGGIGHEWVKQRFISTDIVNKVKHFALVDEVDTRVDKSHPQALSRAFYPATMADNPAGDPQYRNRILLNPDTVERARLLDGNWDVMDLTGRVYPMWSYENITEAADYNPEWPVFWGVDDGFQPGQGKGTISYHPRVFLFFQVTPDGSINLFDEYYAIQELMDKSLDNVLKLPYREPELVYIDSSATELKQRIYDKGISVLPATHKVSEGIKNMRRFILDAQGIRAFKVNPKCKEFIREMAAYKIDENATRSNAGEPIPLKIDDHGPDAARYFLYSRRYEYA